MGIMVGVEGGWGRASVNIVMNLRVQRIYFSS